MMTPLDYWMLDFKSNWKIFLSKKRNILRLVGAFVFFAIVTALFKRDLIVLESKPGVLLSDVILNHLPSIDFSMPVFVLLYFMTTFFQIFLLAYPSIFTYYFFLYGISLFLRYLALQLFVLEPPVGVIPLYDPVLMMSTYNGVTLIKDLFFSGHMVTMLSCYFACPNKNLKKIYLGLTIVITIMLYYQHIHYTIDYMGALIVTFLVYKIYFLRAFERSKKTYPYSPELINV